MQKVDLLSSGKLLDVISLGKCQSGLVFSKAI